MLGAETGTFQLEQSLIGRPKQTRRATELYAYLRVKTHKRTRSKAYFTLIGKKYTKIFWHQSDARTTATIQKLS